MTALLAPRDWNGDGHPDILARTSDGKLLMYRGNGAGGFLHPTAQQIGSGWQVFTALLAPVRLERRRQARHPRPRRRRASCSCTAATARGGFVTGQREQIGGGGGRPSPRSSAGGDFSGDGRPDIIARDGDGLLFMYRGNGRGGFITGQREQIGSGWSSLGALTLVWDAPAARSRPRRAARPPRSPRAARSSSSRRAARGPAGG